MVKIRKLHIKHGDQTTTCTLEEAKKEVNQALKQGLLVVDETNPSERQMLQNVLGIKEESELAIFPAVGGG